MILQYLFLLVDQWCAEENDVSWSEREKTGLFQLKVSNRFQSEEEEKDLPRIRIVTPLKTEPMYVIIHMTAAS